MNQLKMCTLCVRDCSVKPANPYYRVEDLKRKARRPVFSTGMDAQNLL